MTQQYNRLLSVDNNAERWYGNEKPHSPKEHRISISYWGGKAYEKDCSTDYDTF